MAPIRFPYFRLNLTTFNFCDWFHLEPLYLVPYNILVNLQYHNLKYITVYTMILSTYIILYNIKVLIYPSMGYHISMKLLLHNIISSIF